MFNVFDGPLLLCVFYGIRLICDDLHRLATYRFFVITCKGSARRMQSRARSSYAEPQPSLVLATSCLRVQRYKEK